MVDDDTPIADGLVLSNALLLETREELSRADQKASLLLAALGVAIAALIGAFASAGVSPLKFYVLAQAVFWSGCGAASLAFASLGLAVYPYPGIGKQGRMYYFGDVPANKVTESQILDLIKTANHAERSVQQFAVLANSVVRKYRMIRAGMILSGAAFALLFIGTLLGVIR